MAGAGGTSTVNEKARKWLVRRAVQAAPFEACGFILDTGDVVEIRNESLAPLRHFKMCGRDAFSKLNGTLDHVVGIWHTHPRGPHTPSREDLEAIKTGAIQPHWSYYIVTPDGVHEYDASLFAPKDHGHWEQFLEA